MNKDHIVLSHPFKGALFAFFDEQITGGTNIKSIAYHSYYKSLYGKKFRELIDITLTLFIIFEKIYLVPADNPMPSPELSYSKDGYINESLGLISPHDIYIGEYDDLNEIIERDLNDPFIQRAFTAAKIHPNNRRFLLEDIRKEMALSISMDSPILCTSLRKGIIKRLITIDNLDIDKKSTYKLNTIEFIEDYINITGLLLKARSIDDLQFIKSSKNVRRYSQSFRELLNSQNADLTSKDKSKILLKEAIEYNDIIEKSQGYFELTGKIVNYFEMIPGAELAMKTISGLSNALTFGSNQIKKNYEWYNLAPQIHCEIGKKKLIDYISN